jgi:hypothetical protein
MESRISSKFKAEVHRVLLSQVDLEKLSTQLPARHVWPSPRVGSADYCKPERAEVLDGL